uniref:KIAA1755 n=1 Tax=Amazona collaria TaxID=241587 RepID=A0A8B9FIQ5_9PSIT
MDASSLDAAVQGALQALYPPFDATAPTVLGQVFRLLETSYQGDGLCCLLQFLIPAKRLFEHVRQAACAPYFNCIFLHEGWPLCLHEKVVVHLAPLNPLLLRPGDFYLQAEPCKEHSARIIVKHLSQDLCTVEEMPVPEAAYALLFTNEWLEEINSDRAGAPLQTCLVATENGIAPLPWSSIATPEFIDKPTAGADGTSVDTQHDPASEAAAESAGTSRKSSQGKYPGLIKVDQAGLRKKPSALAMPSLCEIISQNLEGEYVDLLELSPEQMDLLDRSLPAGAGDKAALPCVNGGPCRVAPSSEQGPCIPCLGQELSWEPGPHGPRCRHRDSYLAALQNPVSFGAGLMAAILEEPDGPGPGPPPAAPRETPAQSGMGAGSPTLLTHRPQAVVRQSSPRLPPDSGHKFSFLKGPRFGAAPGHERASSQQEGAWRKMSAIYSPRMGRAKAAAKGTVRAGLWYLCRGIAFPCPAALHQLLSSVPMGSPLLQPAAAPAPRAGARSGSGGSRAPFPTGSSDRQGRALLQVTTSGSAWGASWCSAAELGRLILYLSSIARQDVKDVGLTVVVDARKQPPAPVLFSALLSVQAVPGYGPGGVPVSVPQHSPAPCPQVESLPSLKALGRFIDSSQLTPELDGAFPYSHGEWVQFFQVSVSTP